MDKKKERPSTEYMVEMFRKLTASKNDKFEIPHYRDEELPFWGDGGDEDIFKAHPDSKKSLIYRP